MTLVYLWSMIHEGTYWDIPLVLMEKVNLPVHIRAGLHVK